MKTFITMMGAGLLVLSSVTVSDARQHARQQSGGWTTIARITTALATGIVPALAVRPVFPLSMHAAQAAVERRPQPRL